MKNRVPEEEKEKDEDCPSLKKSKSVSTRSEEQEKPSNQASSLSTKPLANPNAIALEEKSKKNEGNTVSADDKNLCGCCGEEECEENVSCSICCENLCGNCLEENRMCEMCYENDENYCKDCAKQNCFKKNGQWTCEVHKKHCRGASHYRFDDDVDEEDGPILGPIFAEN